MPGSVAIPPYEGIAAVYDDLLGDRAFPHLRRTFERIERRFGLRFASAADVGCGTGTFVGYLRARGVQPVWGVDRSPRMLAQAVAKNLGNGARFLLQDLRALRLPHRVGLLTCQFDTLNYMLTPAELRTALTAFADALEPGGHAVFDMIIQRPGTPGPLPRIEEFRWAGRTVTRRTRFDARRRLQLAQVRVEGPYGTSCETHLQRAYTIPEIAAAIGASGLRPRAVHGGDARAVFLVRRG